MLLHVVCATTALSGGAPSHRVVLGGATSVAATGGAGALSRRAVLGGATFVAATVASAPSALALEGLLVDENANKKADIGLLEEIPPKAKQAYLQYLPQLQLAADYFFFELQPMLDQPGRYDRISELTEAGTAGTAATVSRLEREFVTPMKILTLAFPPDLGGEEMQTSLDAFQRSMFVLARQARKGASTGNTAGATPAEIKEIFATYELGRVSLNKFFAAVNEGTGTQRLVEIPTKANEKAYPRSKALYTALLKEAAICRNRGGEALAGLWGGLMVYGTVPGVNPCGNSALAYYSQGL